MKKSMLLVIFTTISFTAGFSQNYSLKFGKVTNDELNMKSYEKDTAAEAVVMYDDGYISYDIVNGNFKTTLYFKQKIKILKQEGLDQANISIPYYYSTTGYKENINNLEAYSYNMENGKAVKTKLEKKYIFDEEVTSKQRRLKFSIPNVKVGSVIEYKYDKTSDDVYDIPDWYIQSSIPVIYSCYEVLIPEYFVFNNETRGYENIKVVETTDNQQFNLGYSSNGPAIVTCQSRRIKFTANSVPALKDEPYVWYKHDFVTGIRFELNGTRYPNQPYKQYAQNWQTLEDALKKETDFGSNLKISNPFKDELKASTDTIKDEKRKIEFIYSFIKQRIKWNDVYSFWGNKAKEAVKNRTGENSQINMILISALKDAGINTFPVLVSNRSRGRIPYTYPTVDRLTTFVVGTETSDGQKYYMDGSATYGGLNMLPSDLLVDRGRTFQRAEEWVDLTRIAKNQLVYLISTKLEKDGKLNGTIKSAHTNQLAYDYKSKYYNAKDSLDFIERFENNSLLKINNMAISGKEMMSPIVQETIDFSKDINSLGDHVYLNPMLFMHIENNPFTQSERKLPVEFNFPYTFQLSNTLEIPENYAVEELPKSIKISLPENAGKCLYQVLQNNNTIQFNYKFDLNQTIFPQDQYNAIREFYAQVATKNAEMIVLKKIK